MQVCDGGGIGNVHKLVPPAVCVVVQSRLLVSIMYHDLADGLAKVRGIEEAGGQT